MAYVDGFVLCVPRKNLDAYKDLATKAGKVWMEYGALSYRECVAEDTAEKEFGMTFPQLAKPTADEVVIFSYITYKSRADRDAINAKVMADPRLMEGCDPNNMPFDSKRMAYSGFDTLVAYGDE